VITLFATTSSNPTVAKLELGMTCEVFFDRCITQSEIEILPVELAHLIGHTKLPMHHRGPFDRLLIAQCGVERWPVLTVDSRFRSYEINVLW